MFEGGSLQLFGLRVLPCLISGLVENIIAKAPKMVEGRGLFSYGPSDHVMDKAWLFVEGAHIDALIAVNMVHALVRLCAIHVPEPKAFLSIQGPFQ
jgi:hypothetical protein